MMFRIDWLFVCAAADLYCVSITLSTQLILTRLGYIANTTLCNTVQCNSWVNASETEHSPRKMYCRTVVLEQGVPKKLYNSKQYVCVLNMLTVHSAGEEDGNGVGGSVKTVGQVKWCRKLKTDLKIFFSKKPWVRLHLQYRIPLKKMQDLTQEQKFRIFISTYLSFLNLSRLILTFSRNKLTRICKI